MSHFRKSELFSRLLEKIAYPKICEASSKKCAPQAAPSLVLPMGCKREDSSADNSNTYEFRPRVRASRPPAIYEIAGGLEDRRNPVKKISGRKVKNEKGKHQVREEKGNPKE